jgi:hypothetical protein
MKPNNASVIRYVGLDIVPDALRKSAFLTELTVNNRALTQLEFKGHVEKLQRRLGKLCQKERSSVARAFFHHVNRCSGAGQGSEKGGLVVEPFCLERFGKTLHLQAAKIDGAGVFSLAIPNIYAIPILAIQTSDGRSCTWPSEERLSIAHGHGILQA